MGAVTYLQAFVENVYAAVKPTAEQSQDGMSWVVSLPIPVLVKVRLSHREVVAGRLNMHGFLRELASRADCAIKAAVQQYHDGAEVARLRERVRILEDGRSDVG